MPSRLQLQLRSFQWCFFWRKKVWFAYLVLKNPLIEEKHTWNSCFFSDVVFFSSGTASERCRKRPPCTQNQKNHTLSKGFFDPSGALTPRWFSLRLEVSWALFGLVWQETTVTIESRILHHYIEKKPEFHFWYKYCFCCLWVPTSMPRMFTISITYNPENQRLPPEK